MGNLHRTSTGIRGRKPGWFFFFFFLLESALDALSGSSIKMKKTLNPGTRFKPGTSFAGVTEKEYWIRVGMGKGRSTADPSLFRYPD